MKTLLHILCLALCCAARDDGNQIFVGHYRGYIAYRLYDLEPEFANREGITVNHLFESKTDYAHHIWLNADGTYERKIVDDFGFGSTVSGTWTIKGDSLIADIDMTKKNDVFRIKSHDQNRLVLEYEVPLKLIPDEIADTLTYETPRKEEWFKDTKGKLEMTFERM